jgi:WD40 repeat protein/tRNA A-37 threonylcarbamoyl transferase component Bud32
MLEAGLETPLASENFEIDPPRQRFGDYELIKEIARGGMGVVFKARQISLDRVVAIKMILTGRFASEVEVQRFREEARAAAALRHPNIVAIHEVGEMEGQPYFSMDLVEGRNLAEAVREGPFNPRRAAACVQAVAGAIQYAHEHGILHRDLKPSNVLLDAEDQPHVTDFGLAKRFTGSQLATEDPQLTQTGQVLGSPNFMPPEQAAGKHRELTPTADVYSLGALLYHLLTGRPPFLADSVAATLRLAEETEPIAPHLLLPSIPRDLETICLKSLQKDPHRRYASARELADELGRFLRDEPIRARRVGRWEKLQRWVRRHPAIAALVGIIGLLLIAVTSVSTIAAARLQKANREGQEKLREAYFAEARANRWSGRPGRRFDSLDAIRKAAAIRSGPDLRDEAIAAMALVDFRPFKTWPLSNDCYHIFDAAYEKYARNQSDGSISVQRVQDDTEVARWPGFGIPVHGYGFSPDGRLLMVHYRSPKNDFAFKVYDVDRPAKVWFDLPGIWVRTTAISPTSPMLAVSWYTLTNKNEGRITLYDLETGKELNSIPTAHMPYTVAFSPNGSQLAVSSEDTGNVYLYSVPDGRNVETLVHSTGVSFLSWAADGRRLVAGCGDGNYYVWDVSSSPPSVELLSQESIARTCWFNQRGDLLATSGWNHLGRLWNLQTGKEIMRFTADALNPFGGNDRWLSMRPNPSSVTLCQFAGGDERRSYHFKTVSGGTYAAVLSPDMDWIVSSHRDGLRFWDCESGQQLHHAAIGEIPSLQFSRDGQSVITGGSGGVYSWPIRSREEAGCKRIEVGPATPLSREKPLSIDPIKRAISRGNRGKAYVFDMESLRIEREFTASPRIHYAAMSPDGRHCATYGWAAKEIEVWDLNDGRRLMGLPASPTPCVGFSTDGRWLVTGFEDDYIFWERGTWTRRHIVSRGVTGGSHGRLAFTSDGSMVALSVGRANIGLYTATTFELLATLESPDAYAISGLEFSRDGSQLMVCSAGQSIQRWDLRRVRQQLAEMKLDIAVPLPAQAMTATMPIEITVLGSTGSRPNSGPVTLDFPRRDGRCTTNQIDLSKFYNATLTNSWFNPKWVQNDLAALPRGLQTLDGVLFDIRGVVQLSCSHPELAIAYPREVIGIPLRQTCRALHFLHADGWAASNGAEIGDYVILYSDGAEQVVPLTYAENIWNWWDIPGQTAPMKPGTTLAWRGRNPLSTRSGIDLLLFHFRWENPRPEVPLVSITFRSSMTHAAPFLVALTAE